MVEEDWKIVGKDAIENRRWISLCPAYPNLKGVTCQDIDEFLGKLPPQVTKEEGWFEKVIDFKKRCQRPLSNPRGFEKGACGSKSLG